MLRKTIITSKDKVDPILRDTTILASQRTTKEVPKKVIQIDSSVSSNPQKANKVSVVSTKQASLNQGEIKTMKTMNK